MRRQNISCDDSRSWLFIHTWTLPFEMFSGIHWTGVISLLVEKWELNIFLWYHTGNISLNKLESSCVQEFAWDWKISFNIYMNGYLSIKLWRIDGFRVLNDRQTSDQSKIAKTIWTRWCSNDFLWNEYQISHWMTVAIRRYRVIRVAISTDVFLKILMQIIEKSLESQSNSFRVVYIFWTRTNPIHQRLEMPSTDSGLFFISVIQTDLWKNETATLSRLLIHIRQINQHFSLLYRDRFVSFGNSLKRSFNRAAWKNCLRPVPLWKPPAIPACDHSSLVMKPGET
jgi:hypothetical protein